MILDISQENKYTETEKEVIDYLMNHLDLLEELSINDLAKKTYTSNATIIRLCRKTGYSGYKALKVDLIKEREVFVKEMEAGMNNQAQLFLQKHLLLHSY